MIQGEKIPSGVLRRTGSVPDVLAVLYGCVTMSSLSCKARIW